MGATASYPLEVRARALALYQQELNAERVASILRVEHGDAAPTGRTVQLWVKRFREVSAKEDAHLLDEQYRVAARSYELIHDAYDWLEDQPGDIKAKHLFQFNAVGGTAMDKLHRASNEGHSQQAGVYVVVLNAQPPQDAIPFIDGQATLLPPATDAKDSQAG